MGGVVAPHYQSGTLAMTFARANQSARTRRDFLSPSTASISVAITGVATPVIADVASGSPNCTATAAGRTCTVAISAAPVGTDTFNVTLYDGPNATGNKLGTGSATQAVVAGSPFSVAIVAAGIASSLGLSAARTSFTPGTAATTALTLTVKDADGNTIAGTYAAPITLTDSDTTGAFTVSPTSVASSSQAIVLSYNGSAGVTTATISASATGVQAVNVRPLLLLVSGIFEFALPAGTSPGFLTLGPDKNLWFGTATGLARFAQTTGTFTPFSVPSGAGAGVSRLTDGPDGNLYITEFGNGNIASVTTAGVVTEYTAPTTFSQNTGIATGPDGNIWFSEAHGGNIGRFTLPGGVFTEFPIPTADSNPLGIVAGPDGALWFTEYYTAKIGRITTAGAFTEYPLSASAGPDMIVVGPDNNLWLTEATAGKIGRITTAGVVTEFAIPSGSASSPVQIAAGPDGNLWFAEFGSNNIGRSSVTGTITEYLLPTAGSEPNGIVAGPDGYMYFTEVATSKIGRISPAAP